VNSISASRTWGSGCRQHHGFLVSKFHVSVHSGEVLFRLFESYYCRMTNYELLRSLVETLSRDVDHYGMINASRSTVCHYNDKRSRDRLSL